MAKTLEALAVHVQKELDETKKEIIEQKEIGGDKPPLKIENDIKNLEKYVELIDNFMERVKLARKAQVKTTDEFEKRVPQFVHDHRKLRQENPDQVV